MRSAGAQARSRANPKTSAADSASLPDAPSNRVGVETNKHVVTMSPGHLREQGLESFRTQAWTDALEQLSAADREDPLDPGDLIRLAMAAYLVGRDEESVEVLARAYQACTAAGETALSVRCCFWIGFQLITKGDMAQAGGWFARGGSGLAEMDEESAEHGFMLVPVALQNLFGGDFAASFEHFDRAYEIGKRFGDPDLITIAGLGRGQAVIGRGDTAEGVAMLDEVMIRVISGEVSTMIGGLVYCAVISVCHEIFDLRRAHEWTAALSRWCEAQPDLVPYRGQCLVHRSQMKHFRGDWLDALTEAELARDQLLQAPDRGSVGLAYYQLGELYRTRGDLVEAEAAYRESNDAGHEPQPGLALLRMAQNNLEAAAATIRRVHDESGDPYHLYRALPAYVEIMLAAGDLAAARAGADEMLEVSAPMEAPALRAMARHARGAVLVADDDPQGALVELRAALAIWQELESPYEGARTRLLIGQACAALGDLDTAHMEYDSARLIFEKLGALPDLVRAEELEGIRPPTAADGLTGREMEVLALIATGKTNRAIGADLVISEKTVARHVSNIFVKLGVTSRAAATAYAFKHDLA